MELNEVFYLANEGVVKFVGIQEQVYNEQTIKQYVFVPFYDSVNNLQMMIPESIVFSKIRPIMNKEEANKIIDSIRNFYLFEWDNNNKTRRLSFEEIIKSGNSMEISKLIYLVKRKEVELKGTKKTLSKSDGDLMKRGIKLLFGELAYALNTTIEEINRCYNNFIK